MEILRSCAPTPQSAHDAVRFSGRVPHTPLMRARREAAKELSPLVQLLQGFLVRPCLLAAPPPLLLAQFDELQLEEHDRINGGTASACMGLVYELAHKREIKCALQVAIEVIARN